jgi:hypothetical protein
MDNTKSTTAHLAGRKDESDNSPQDAANDSLPVPDSTDLQLDLHFVSSVRRLIGFFRARDLLYEMHFFNGWEAPDLLEERSENACAQRERLDQAILAMNRLSVITTLAEKPILRELEEAAIALADKLRGALVDHHPQLIPATTLSEMGR